ncbi:FAD-dependent oxidoreductase [Micrococcus terreus]|uniref:flavin-containing monooxygenase n=1 Tax=Micrococcus terreus TaxID=574650 RepID=UPI0033C357D7
MCDTSRSTTFSTSKTPTTPVRTVAVIGAGSSGIASLKALTEAGLTATAFDVSDRIGGNWAIHNPNGMSAAYETLFMNTSRERMQYADFPINPAYPDFPRHDQIAQYFNDYADHFGLRPHIRFRTRVDHVSPQPGGGFQLTTTALPHPVSGTEGAPQGGGEGGATSTETFDAVVIANGHHWLPRWPDPMPEGADSFTGEIMHAHAYRSPQQLAERRVVVVGLGNSATDIAVDASYLAASTTLSVRRGAHVLPKYLFGCPSTSSG